MFFPLKPCNLYTQWNQNKCISCKKYNEPSYRENISSGNRYTSQICSTMKTIFTARSLVTDLASSKRCHRRQQPLTRRTYVYFSSGLPPNCRSLPNQPCACACALARARKRARACVVLITCTRTRAPSKHYINEIFRSPLFH